LIGLKWDKKDHFFESLGAALWCPIAIFGHWVSPQALKSEFAWRFTCVPASKADTHIKKRHHSQGSKALQLAWTGSWRTLGLAFAVPNLHLDPPLVMAAVLSQIF
jgi:hypothetical protein